MEYPEDNIEDSQCLCGKCRECELIIALHYETSQPELLTQWVRKYELSKKWKKVKPEKPPLPVPAVRREMPPGASSAYELTLTTPEDDPYYLREALTNIVNSAMFDVHSYEACLELTEAGIPHIHAILYSKKKYLDATKIKTKFKHRYELKRVRDLTKYINYIKKEDGSPIIQEYCLKKGIPQFWDGR